MKPLQLIVTGTLLALLTAGTAESYADELDVTMKVIDDLSDVDDGDFIAAENKDPYSLFELDSGEDGAEVTPDQEKVSLFAQFEAMDGEFQIDDSSDGFEFESVQDTSLEGFESEDNFEEGEDIELDLYDDEMLLESIADPAT